MIPSSSLAPNVLLHRTSSLSKKSLSRLAMTTMTASTLENLVVPMAAAGAAGLLLGYPTVKLMRGYFRSIEAMARQLSNVSFDSCHCSCCDQEHVTPTGQPMICDREVVRQCVLTWFGSEEAFEESVRSEVLEILRTDLERAFSLEWALGVTMPAVLADVDFAATHARLQQYDWMAAYLIDGLVLWLIFVPDCKDLMLQILRRCRNKASTPCREALYNFAVMMLTGMPIILALTIYAVGSFMVYVPVTSNGGSPLSSSAVWLLWSILQASMSRLIVRRLRSST